MNLIEQTKKHYGIDNREIIRDIQTACPKFAKGQLSMVLRSDEYGVVLSPLAKRTLEIRHPLPHRQRHNPDMHRIEISVDDETYNSLESLRKLLGFNSIPETVKQVCIGAIHRANRLFDNEPTTQQPHRKV